MNTITRLCLIILIALGTLALSTTAPVLADCAETSPDVWECDSTPQDTDGLNVQDGDADLVTVNEDASVTNPTGDGIEGDDGDTVINNGVVTATGSSIEIIGPSASASNSVNNLGTVSSDGGDGVFIIGDGAAASNTVTNSGEITGYINGVFIYGLGTDSTNTVINTGTITSESFAGVGMSGGDFSTNTVTNFGDIASAGAGVDIFSAESAANTVTNFGSINSAGDAVSVGGGNAFLYNSGTIASVNGSAVDFEFAATGVIVNDGLMISQNGSAILGGSETDGPMTLINNGLIVGNDLGPDNAVIDFWDGDDLIVNNGSIITLNGSLALDTEAGDDVVIIGAGGVSYGQVCGDIGVTNVDSRGATVSGLMDGGDDHDTLVFGFLTTSQEAADAFAAEAANYGEAASQTINGQEYTWDNFENIQVNATIFTEGATRLYDDGVVLAFASNGGILVCSGEAGTRAGTIDFALLDGGRRVFSAGNSGWSVVVSALGGGKYEVQLFDGNGAEHINDADGDGVADSRFTFTR